MIGVTFACVLEEIFKEKDVTWDSFSRGVMSRVEKKGCYLVFFL